MREQGPRAGFGPLACLSLALLVLGCAERGAVASGSADAYDQARGDDAPVRRADHGHGSRPRASAGPGEAQEGASSEPRTAWAQQDHMDHSQMGHSSAGSGHERTAPGGTAMARGPETTASTAAAGAPAASLRPSDIDAPAPTSAAEALRAERLAAEMAGGAHSMHHGTYSHTDAGRESTAAAPGTGAAHHGHQPPPVAPTPGDGVHRGHDAPPASKPAPVPSHDHAGGPPVERSPRPSPRPTPSPTPHRQEHR